MWHGGHWVESGYSLIPRFFETLQIPFILIDAGRRTKFAPVKSLNSSEFSSEFSDLKTLSSNVKVNPVIS